MSACPGCIPGAAPRFSRRCRCPIYRQGAIAEAEPGGRGGGGGAGTRANAAAKGAKDRVRITSDRHASTIHKEPIDDLQHTNHDLEFRLLQLQESKESVNGQVKDLTRKNEQLCKELTEIDKLAEQLERDKELVIDTAEHEIKETQIQIEQQQRTIDKLQSENQNLRSDAETIKQHLQKSESEIEVKNEENRTLNILLDQLQEEKGLLNKKVSKLEKAEKNSILSSEKPQDMIPSKLDCFVKSLEKERDHYKRECEKLRKAIRCRSGSPNRSPVQTANLDYELVQILKERDELQLLLQKYERHMSEIQANVKVLTSERDKTNILYHRAQEEVARLRRDAMKSPKAPKAAFTAQTILRHVESERDGAILDFRRMTTERDSLRERLKISQETAINERAHLEQQIEEYCASMRLIEEENLENKSKLSMMRQTLAAMEDDMKVLKRKLLEADNELGRQRLACDSLRSLNDEMEGSLEDTRCQLSMKQNELEMAHETIEQVDAKNGELTNQCMSQREEINLLRTTISEMHKEKDSLIHCTDSKTEKLATLEESLAMKELTVSSLSEMVAEMEEALRQARDTASIKEQEAARLRRQLDDTSDELSRTGRDRESMVQENSQLYDQLSKTKQENQTLNYRLKDTQKELEDLKLKVQDTITDVSRLENQIHCKEKENREHLDKYRQASADAEAWQNKWQQAEGELSCMRLEVLNCESERRRMKERLDSLELECDQHLSTGKSHKSQVSNLNECIAKKEEELQTIKSEKATALSDLASTRELCIKLDASKEAVLRQLNTKTEDAEQLQKELTTAHSEIDLLRKQLGSERISAKNLESLLVSNQEKEFQAQVVTQELDSEIEDLKEKLALTENKLASHCRENTHLKNKLSQLEAELDIIKRQLGTERFERERAVKELRRQNYSTPSQASSSLDRSLSPTCHSPDRSMRRQGTYSRSTERTLGRSTVYRDY